MVLVDKRRHESALRLAKFFVGDEDVMKLLFGDKDAFKFGFVGLGESFALNRDRPTQILFSAETSKSFKQPPMSLLETQMKDLGYMREPEYHRTGELQRISG